MKYTAEVEHMCPLAKAAYHGPAPIPEEGEWVKAKTVEDISGFTHGIGWCAPQQGACKLTLNVKKGVIEEAKQAGEYTLTKYSSEKKEVKAKGDVIDEYYKVDLTKVFNADIKDPINVASVIYEVE